MAMTAEQLEKKLKTVTAIEFEPGQASQGMRALLEKGVVHYIGGERYVVQRQHIEMLEEKGIGYKTVTVEIDPFYMLR